MILLFILFVSVRAECRNGGSLQDGICECVNGYYGNHCQVSPSTLCSYGDSVVNLDTHVIFNSEVKAKCTTPSDDCYATPWSLSVSNEISLVQLLSTREQLNNIGSNGTACHERES